MIAGDYTPGIHRTGNFAASARLRAFRKWRLEVIEDICIYYLCHMSFAPTSITFLEVANADNSNCH
jgi:hypothetical protein